MIKSSFVRKPWFWGICVVFVGAFAFTQFQPNAHPVEAPGDDFQELSSSAPIKTPIDEIVVEKAQHMMTLVSDGKAVRTYSVSFGANPVGHKIQEGDERTPEGTYTITAHNSKSDFYKSLRVSYPNDEDKAAAKAQGLNPGGDIMIHGLPNGYAWIGTWHRMMDWTDGCIAVTNPEIDEIYTLVHKGTKITILP